MFAYTAKEYNYLETLQDVHHYRHTARQNQSFQDNIFDKAPGRWIAIAMTANSALIGSCSEDLFWHHQIELRQNRRFRGGQPTVDFDAADNCRLYVRTKEV